ncbi:glutathione S-transferase [Cladorrhinum sp. PSN332]|nr:glutathione S-transferase [Cladorrhinum sp. PSN332]
MRDLGSVCLRCQLRLLIAPGARPRAARPRQQQLRYNSTRTAPDDIRPRHNHASPSSPHRTGDPRLAPGLGLSSAAAAAAAERRANAVAMFKSIVGAPAMERPKRNIEDTSDGIELVKLVSKMQSILGRENPQTIDAYNFFDENIYPMIQKLGADVSKHITESIGTVLLSKLAKEKVGDFDIGNLPTVTRLTDIMIDLNVLRPAIWGKLILELAQHICRQEVSPDHFDSIKSYENAMAHRNHLLRDLLGAWRSFAAHRPAERKPAETDGEATQATPLRKQNLVEAFSEAFHQYTLGTLPRPTWAAYATFRMMQDPINVNRSTEKAAAPFLHMMKQMVHRTVAPTHSKYEKELSSYPDLLCYLHKRSGISRTGESNPNYTNPTKPMSADHTDTIRSTDSIKPADNIKTTVESIAPVDNINPAPTIKSTASTTATDSTKPADSTAQPIRVLSTDHTDNSRKKNTRIHNNSGIKSGRLSGQSTRDKLQQQLSQALKHRSVTGARKVWAEFWGPDAVPDPARIEKLAKHVPMFDYFILAYMTMKQPHLAIEVWDKMGSIGVKPTIKTWNSMMQGCAVTKNPDGIRVVWEKLITSGMKLDTAIWTARVSGLINSGDPDAALRALNEMAIVWNQRGKPEMANIAVQPSIEPVNAALAGLFRLNRDDSARRVLSWAASHNIKPDIVTFNTLLRPLLRRGDHQGVDGILATMRGLKMDPDIATFTVMIEGTLAHDGTRDPAEQVKIVNRIITEMNAAGIDANMITYATMIQTLLQGSDGGEKAVLAVLAHIWNSGQELSSHIYTMLAEYYLTRDPPDIEAVTRLIEKRNLKVNRNIDRVFWERVIKGYCVNGEIHRALDIFQNVVVPTGITRMTHDTLYEFLWGLQEIQAWDAAQDLVNYVSFLPEDGFTEVTGGGHFPVRDDPLRAYRHRFWHLANRMGLVRGQAAVKYRTAMSRMDG